MYRVRVVQPLEISRLSPTDAEDQSSDSTQQDMEDTTEKRRRLSLSVMLSKPILALEFNCLNMNVEHPLIISQ